MDLPQPTALAFNASDEPPPPLDLERARSHRPLAIAARWPLVLLCLPGCLELHRLDLEAGEAGEAGEVGGEAGGETGKNKMGGDKARREAGGEAGVAGGSGDASGPCRLRLVQTLAYPPFLMEGIDEIQEYTKQ